MSNSAVFISYEINLCRNVHSPRADVFKTPLVHRLNKVTNPEVRKNIRFTYFLSYFLKLISKRKDLCLQK